ARRSRGSGCVFPYIHWMEVRGMAQAQQGGQWGLHGKFIWYELMTGDVAAATAFYQSVIGWRAEKFDSSEIDYTILSMGEHSAAGAMPTPPGAQPGWIGYVAVDNVDDSAAQVKALGGVIHKAAAD